MSRILRRPMFRGGPVSSYGTGIASGLGKPKRGFVDEPGSYAGEEFLIGQGMFDELQNKGGSRSYTRYNKPIGPPSGRGLSGGNLYTRAMAKARNIPYLGRFAVPLMGTAAPFATAASVGTGIGALTDFYAKSTYTPEGYKRLKEMSGPNYAFDETETGEDMEAAQAYIDEGNQIGEAPGFFPQGGKDKFYKDKGLDPETGLPIPVEDTEDFKEFEEETDKAGLAQRKPGENALDALLREGLEKSKKRDLANNPPPEPKVDIKAQIDKDKELFAELLGTQKMRRRYGEDVLGELSKGFLEGEGFKGALKRAVGVKSGEDKIDQTAAMLAINDYIAGKRSKEQTEKLIAGTKFKVDYASDVEAAKLDIANMPFEKAKLVMASIMKETDINAPKVIKSILSQKFPQKQINITSFPNDDLNAIVNKDATEFNEGINIVQYKGGKILIERIGESLTQVPDLYVT
mgnify:CR=1 FL=1|tara:strand:+ start:868 stop:2247 length:1380 start_codon:yes stop_codon:yes gene_type:complete